MNVRNTITPTATSCCVERLIACFFEMLIGGMIQIIGEIVGANTPRNREKATATAAMVPV